MQKVNIDGKEIDIETLSVDARNQLQMLQVTDREILRLNAQLAIAQTARNAYANALKGLLPEEGASMSQSDTVRFS